MNHWTYTFVSTEPCPGHHQSKVLAIAPETVHTSPISFAYCALSPNSKCCLFCWATLSTSSVNLCPLERQVLRQDYTSGIYLGKVSIRDKGMESEEVMVNLCSSSRSDPYEGERKCCIERVSDYSMFLRKF